MKEDKVGIRLVFFLVGFCFFSLIPVVFLWGEMSRMLVTMLVSLLIVALIINKGTEKKRIPVAFLFSLLYFVIALRSEKNIIGSLYTLLIIPIFFLNKNVINRIYIPFHTIFSLVTGLSLIVYIAVVIVGVSLPNQMIPPLNDIKKGTYYLYPFLVTYYDKFFTSPRFYCLFDEPGVMGTFSAIILVVERFNLRDWKNIIILLGGIFSLSFFFFIICGVYLFFLGSWKVKTVSAIVVVISAIALKDNEIVEEKVFSRFVVEDGELAGDNRLNSTFDNYYKNFKKSPYYLWGLGGDKGTEINEGGSSYKQVIVSNGLIWFVFYIFAWGLLMIGSVKGIRSSFPVLLCILGTLYQRPDVHMISYAFLFLVLIGRYSNVTNLSKTFSR